MSTFAIDTAVKQVNYYNPCHLEHAVEQTSTYFKLKREMC